MFPLIRITDSFQIPTYFLIISLTYTWAVYWTFRRAKARGFDVTNALDIGLALMLGGLIGARALHVFYEGWDVYSEQPLRIIYLWEGGFVFYGGFIGALVLSSILIWKRHLLFFEWADFFSPVFAFGYAIGRTGCLLAGCCYGRACDLPWAMHFPVDALARHPAQLYATFWEASVGLVLLRFEKRTSRGLGQIFSLWLILHAIGRFIMESFRDDFRGEDIFGLSISSNLSLLLLIVGLYIFWRRRNPPFPAP